MKRAKVWFVTSADGMPGRSLHPSHKWHPCVKMRRMYTGSSQAGFQKEPVTLRDNRNKKGGYELSTVWGTTRRA
jgi:hypothetical protein